ncbi:hypothetical protein EHO61_09525 [Leptospira fluminis]|uniref:Phospholipase n=1 Tax=Leptospira fluminis TaxID=2484979 RepID=A0A4R9GPF1_9LEPT|nr:hypothetical protein [Leptospira fluminis]TGK18813.1 hypothetical protein EHO61_09525 [Leptospira fluminis]
MRFVSLLLFSNLLLLCFSPPLSAWGSHYLIIDRVLEHSSAAFAGREVDAEELEDFVSKEAGGLKEVFDGYYRWLEVKGAKRFKPQILDANVAKKRPLQEFLKAARLRPAHRFYSVRRLLPNETAKFGFVDRFRVYPYLEKREMGRYFFENVKGKKISVRSILTTYVDEPDWGMDHELWNIPEYGYGTQPFGNPRGESSKAPFHMLFRHENFFVKTFAPEMSTGSMLPERVELFRRLSEFAGKTGHPFWEYRFAAWVCHYVQDIGQPYHSKAVPSAGYYYYLKFALNSAENRAKIKKETTQIVANRHFIYEDFVAYGLYKSYATQDPIFENLKAYLSSGDPFLTGVNSVDDLLSKEGELAADHSPLIDSTIVKVFGKKRTTDPTYDLERDPEYEISGVVRGIDSEKGNELARETGRDFRITAQSTRTVLMLIGVYGNKK